jgi:hypothetical protein
MLLTERYFDPSGALCSEIRYIYDDEGRLVAEQSVTQEGKVSTPVTYSYDDEGHKLKVEELDFADTAQYVTGACHYVLFFDSAAPMPITHRSRAFRTAGAQDGLDDLVCAALRTSRYLATSEYPLPDRSDRLTILLTKSSLTE